MVRMWNLKSIKDGRWEISLSLKTLKLFLCYKQSFVWIKMKLYILCFLAVVACACVSALPKPEPAGSELTQEQKDKLYADYEKQLEKEKHFPYKPFAEIRDTLGAIGYTGEFWALALKEILKKDINDARNNKKEWKCFPKCKKNEIQ